MSEKIKERGIPAGQVRQEMNEEHAQLPAATVEQIEAAIEVLGNELARRSALNELAGESDIDLLSAMHALGWVEWTLRRAEMSDENYFDMAEEVRESLARLLATAPQA